MSDSLPSSQPLELLNHVISAYIFNESTVHKNLPFVLEVIVNHQLLAQKTDQAGADTSKHVPARWAAISLIKITCEQSPALLLANIRAWTAQLLGLVLKPEPTMIHEEAIRTLSFLFASTIDKPELQREVTTPNLPRFNQALVSLSQNRELLPITLAALTVNVDKFPSVSRHVADHCLKICLNCLDGEMDIEPSLVETVGHCLASLHQTGGKTNLATQWKDTLLRLVGSVHQSLGRLFETVDEELDIEASLPGFPVRSPSIDYIESFPLLVRRIKYLTECIVIIISSKTSVAVSVPVGHLIDLICRIYNVYNGTLVVEKRPESVITSSQNKKSGKKRRHEVTNSDALTTDQQTSSNDCDLQLAALEALQNLINFYGPSMELTLRSSVDSGLLSNMLQAIQTVSTSSEQNALVRYKLYECLIASVMHPIEAQASILPHAVRIFSAGMNDQSHQLQMICMQGLAICDLIMHPRMPPIQRNPVHGPVVRLPGNDLYETSAPAHSPEPALDNNPNVTIVSKTQEEIILDQLKEVPHHNQAHVALSPPEVAQINTINQSSVTFTQVNVKKDIATTNEETIVAQNDPIPSGAADILEPTESESERPISIDQRPAFPPPTSSIMSEEKEPNVQPTVALVESSEDDDMEMPDIDLAGPDTDAEE
ncbi:hypothetical protein DFQ28_001083 [Apophysomyces sp. BC1034]|nr:hypothetical protein DFQ29_000783 [Apophysomyces sp. BC1021]KAG0183742.1 hypothetical protein DFQ28_001083 [Apophysomyces sp. BC1034]